MQRAASTGSQDRPGPRHRKADRPDRVLLTLKIATFLAATVLVSSVVLLVTFGDNTQPAAGRQSPAIPTITNSQPADDASAAPSTEPTTIVAPTMNTETANIVASPTPPPVPSPSTPPPASSRPPQIRFAVIGDRCDNPGAFSVTRDFQAVVCARQQHGSPRWRPVN